MAHFCPASLVFTGGTVPDLTCQLLSGEEDTFFPPNAEIETQKMQQKKTCVTPAECTGIIYQCQLMVQCQNIEQLNGRVKNGTQKKYADKIGAKCWSNDQTGAKAGNFFEKSLEEWRLNILKAIVLVSRTNVGNINFRKYLIKHTFYNKLLSFFLKQASVWILIKFLLKTARCFELFLL